ncbi:MAG: flagella basal body P-ring formation protein FlgA, partial [Rhodospirillales bacterium]|nr:flagella basal body P-ring formation protein FlgA [Rhodospirillales bacterium]
MKPFAVVLALLAGLAGVSPAPAEAARLRTHIVVEDDVIRLGDLFADAGPRANVAVAQAPAPGRRSTFELGWLAEIARAYQVAWRPQSRFDRAVVERAGKMIGQSEIMKSLSASLAANGMRRGDQIDLSNRNLDIAVPLSAPASVEVIN